MRRRGEDWNNPGQRHGGKIEEGREMCVGSRLDKMLYIYTDYDEKARNYDFYDFNWFSISMKFSHFHNLVLLTALKLKK